MELSYLSCSVYVYDTCLLFQAKLKAHIHDPNAPELVHFLFTPLSLIYEASRDPIHDRRDLGSEAVAPLLLNDAKQLLLNCLTSKELELWQRLGKSWTMTKYVEVSTLCNKHEVILGKKTA